MLHKIALTLLLLSSCASLAGEREARAGKIKRKIMKMKKNIHPIYASTLAKIIVDASWRYDVPENVLTAILMVESGFKLHAMRYCRKAKRVTDYGIGQIHIAQIKRKGFDKDRLITDLDYSVKAAASILSWFKKKYEKKHKFWAARYNCGVKKKITGGTCRRYIKKLRRYL